jgi:hypothetical protein
MSYLPCRVATLPEEKRIAAARAAVEGNPANATLPGVLGGYEPLPIQHIAALTGKLWPASGVRAAVQFLDNPDAETRRKILLAANAWGQDPRGGNVVFVETRGQGDVRLARTPGQGYWSYLGQDNAHVPAGRQTMNLDSFTARTPDSEYKRVVPHEFGHYLGWPHEHTRKEIVGRIDPAAADAYFLKFDGWDAQTVQQQVLTPTPDGLITALPADVRSIMCYGFPAEIMRDHVAVPGGLDIDDEDFALCAQLYPRKDAPPTPPTPPPPPPGAGPTLAQVLAVDEAVFARLKKGFARNRGAGPALDKARADLETKHRALFGG